MSVYFQPDITLCTCQLSKWRPQRVLLHSWRAWVPGWGRHRFTTKRMCEVKLGLGWAPTTPQLGSRPQCLFPLAWSQKEVQVISLSSVYKYHHCHWNRSKLPSIQSIQNLLFEPPNFSFLKKTSSENAELCASSGSLQHSTVLMSARLRWNKERAQQCWVTVVTVGTWHHKTTLHTERLCIQYHSLRSAQKYDDSEFKLHPSKSLQFHSWRQK